MSDKRTLRCVVYTRKSTEEGLDQEFNSLDAQREACQAYIRSQTHEGWKLIGDSYDDGGYSGGSMDRPGLQALLTAIRERRIDTVVVYKIDRLTRSLADFARIVETFEAHAVSFVSVTQAFNTTTSMGRLTLNVLLSFAQFEREVTAERIRDKIAASKRKGMWTGGLPPLGYDAKERRLIPNEAEADIVRTLFQLYLKLQNVRRLKEEACALGLTTKRRCSSSGVNTGGTAFSRGHLYALLRNPIYVGRVAHRGETHPGQHLPTIDQETWDAVQGMLADGRAEPGSALRRSAEPSLLTGLVFDETGDRLSPSHAVKGKRRYRYYISHRLMQANRRGGDGWRLPARELESVVLKALTGMLRDPVRLVEHLRIDGLRPDRLDGVISKAELLAAVITTSGPEQRDLLLRIVHRIEIAAGVTRMQLSRSSLQALLLGADGDAARSASENEATIVVDVPFSLRRRGVEAKLIVGSKTATANAVPDRGLIDLLTKARRALAMLSSGEATSVNSVGAALGMHPSDVTRIQLAYLAPDIIDAIIDGRHPTDLTANRLRSLCPLPADWTQQRRVLGFGVR